MDAGNAEIESIRRLLLLSKELIDLDVRSESYTRMLESYCGEVERHLSLNPLEVEGATAGAEKMKVSSVLDELMQELVKNHQEVLDRAVLAKEGVASDLAKLRKTRRGMIAYLSQSLDKKDSP